MSRILVFRETNYCVLSGNPTRSIRLLDGRAVLASDKRACAEGPARGCRSFPSTRHYTGRITVASIGWKTVSYGSMICYG